MSSCELVSLANGGLSNFFWEIFVPPGYRFTKHHNKICHQGMVLRLMWTGWTGLVVGKDSRGSMISREVLRSCFLFCRSQPPNLSFQLTWAGPKLILWTKPSSCWPKPVLLSSLSQTIPRTSLQLEEMELQLQFNFRSKKKLPALWPLRLKRMVELML